MSKTAGRAAPKKSAAAKKSAPEPDNDDYFEDDSDPGATPDPDPKPDAASRRTFAMMERKIKSNIEDKEREINGIRAKQADLQKDLDVIELSIADLRDLLDE